MGLLAMIPESLWGVIVGTLLTLLSTLLVTSLTNRHGRKLQAQQLQSKSTERQRERHATLRRDVYLPAADAFTGVVSGMARLLNVEVPDDDIADRAQAFGAALTRMQMIASPETIRRIAEFQREFLGTLGMLQQLRLPMRMRQQQIDIAAGALETESQRDELTRYYEVWLEWLRLRLAQEMARAEMVRAFVRRMERLTKLQAPLLAAVRGELEGDEALHLITEEAEKTSAVGVRTVTDMIPTIERNIEEMRKDLAHHENVKRAGSGPR
ncbi:MAG TPA: hypothetical protein VG897_18375 [Terriglobales bacterium]|nr:hypothetical protein [Terriglobales bacterium]